MKQRGGKIMRVRCALSTLMGREKYQIQDVHEKTGLSRSTVSNLYNEKSKRIDYDTIPVSYTHLDVYKRQDVYT